MGKASKGSRKGKKAWRANISTADIDDYFEKTTKDSLSGASAAIASAPSDALFFFDKSTDVPAKKKIEKKREKVLNYERLFLRNPFVQPVPSSTLKKLKKKAKARKEKEGNQLASEVEEEPGANENLDIWSENGDGNAKARKKSSSHIPAVEVEPPGCSFNPSFEDHQDSLAQAVAVEMQKVYKKELEPEPVPLTVHGEVMDEEDKYFLDADDGNENDMIEDVNSAGDDLIPQVTNPSLGALEELEDVTTRFTSSVNKLKVKPKLPVNITDGPNHNECSITSWNLEDVNELCERLPFSVNHKRRPKVKKLTRVDLNRRARRNEQLRAEAEAKKLESLHKDIDCLPAIMQEIHKEDEEKHKRHLRRVVARQERLKSGPPCLGKNKFEPAPPQVLLTEEISGSLRKLKGCCTLASDRFKSFQKRGLIVPTKKRR